MVVCSTPFELDSKEECNPREPLNLWVFADKLAWVSNYFFSSKVQISSKVQNVKLTAKPFLAAAVQKCWKEFSLDETARHQWWNTPNASIISWPSTKWRIGRCSDKKAPAMLTGEHLPAPYLADVKNGDAYKLHRRGTLRTAFWGNEEQEATVMPWASLHCAACVWEMGSSPSLLPALAASIRLARHTAIQVFCEFTKDFAI